jgi:hypothetical protein
MNFKELTNYFIEEKEFTNFKEIKDGKEKESIGTDSTFSDFIPREKTTNTEKRSKEPNKKPTPKKNEKKNTKTSETHTKKHNCPECEKLKKICPKCKKLKEKKRTLKEEIQYQSDILLEKRKWYDDVSIYDEEGEEDLKKYSVINGNFNILTENEIILSEGIKHLKISKSLSNLKQRIENNIKDESDKKIISNLLKEINSAISEFKKKEQEYKIADVAQIDKSKIKQDYKELQKKYKKILEQTTSGKVKSVLKKVGIGALVAGVIGGLTTIFGHTNTGQQIWNRLMMTKLDIEEGMEKILYKINKELDPAVSPGERVGKIATRVKDSIENTVRKVPKVVNIEALKIDKKL